MWLLGTDLDLDVDAIAWFWSEFEVGEGGNEAYETGYNHENG